MEMIQTFAPGKIMLAGEWSVLEAGNPCVALAATKGVMATLTKNKTFFIDAPNLCLQTSAVFKNNAFLLEPPTQKLTFVQHACEVVLRYLQEQNIEIKPFTLSLASQISSFTLPDCTITKLGLGSSSASVVAVVKGILLWHGVKISNELVFKLSSVAHFHTQGNVGSCYDTAIATYQKHLTYRQFDPLWLAQQPTSSISNLVSQAWPQLSIATLTLPTTINILIGFTGKSSSTKNLVTAMNNFKKTNSTTHKAICDAITHVVIKLIAAIKKEDYEEILSLLQKNRTLLQKLEKASGIVLETPELKKLCDVAERCGGAAKLSGAGGGDCGIAVCFNDKTAQNILQAWQNNDIYPIDVFSTS